MNKVKLIGWNSEGIKMTIKIPEYNNPWTNQQINAFRHLMESFGFYREERK